MLLLGSTVCLFAQNKLPYATQEAPIAQWTSFAANLSRFCKTYSTAPLDLQNRISDSLYQQCRTSEWVKDALNEQLKSVSKPWGKHLRPDSLTTAYALQYLRQHAPRVLHIGLGETDEYAHEKKYAEYLQAAQANDRMIGQIWQFVQSSPRYRNKTTLFITTDHGRGNSPATWHKHHGWVNGAEEIWFAVMGPQTAPLGEVENSAPYYQCQFAQTFAAFLGLEYQGDKAVALKISDLFIKRSLPPEQPITNKIIDNQLITKK